MASRLRAVLLSALAVLAAVTAGCGGPGEVSREEIRAALADYLPALAACYAAAGDETLLAQRLETLGEYAVPKEVVWVAQQAEDQLSQGLVVVPELKELTVEDVQVASHSTVFVTTLEVWDLRKVAVGTEQVLSQALDRAHRVKYHMGRHEGRWKVYSRQVEQAFE